MSEQLLYTASVNFEAARLVTCLPSGHRSRKLHGHSFLAEVRCSLPEKWASFPGNEIEQLQEQLASAVSLLDYNDLNLVIEQPTDENIARWIRSQLDLSHIDAISVQSTVNEGVDIDSHEQAHIWRRYTFESAHQLPNVPLGHKCGRMHGHGFEVILHANQDIGGREIGVDYDYLDSLWAPIYAELDHACLNDIPGLSNPTSEVISCWIWQRIKPHLSELSWVTVYETASCGAHFDGKNYRIWKEMTFDSAMQLQHAPEGDSRRRIHGHTYTLRLHLHAELDELKGWTVDFGDVKQLFDPIFKRLDHHPLYEIDGLEDTNIASLIRWIKVQASPLLPHLDRIDLYETRGCGAILSWGNNGPALPI
jgi:6-pyruvoyltetrahydropterin/6-carboxytetrahydropterin synthase